MFLAAMSDLLTVGVALLVRQQLLLVPANYAIGGKHWQLCCSGRVQSSAKAVSGQDTMTGTRPCLLQVLDNTLVWHKRIARPRRTC